MKLFFDYQAFEMQSIGGVSRSYAEVIARLKRTEGINCLVGIRESDNAHLKECGLSEKVKALHYTHNLFFGGRKLFRGQRYLARKALCAMGHRNDGLNVNQDYCIKQLKRQRFDVFEPTFFDSYFLPYLKDKPFVLTVHDMIPELFPQHFDRDDFQIVQKRLLCPLAAHIHVPSRKTKEDLVRILDVPPEKITVIPHGRPEFIADDYMESPIFDFPYFLYVGDRFGYKNFSKFVKECSYLLKKYPEIRVVCSGRAFSESEEEELLKLKMAKNVVHRFASDESLRNLYHYALAFVYPSAYEGFGLPILEAFTSECPVLLNNASCFPEVAEDAAIYFDIDKDGDLFEKLECLYSAGEGMRKELIQKGRAQAEKFSWEKSAKQLINVYESL